MALSASEPSLGRSGAGRPSTVARRENRRWDALDTLRGRTGTGSFALGRRRSEDGRSGSRRDSVEQMAETFGRDMRGVTDRLEDIVRNLRFEDLKSKQEKEERKRREEEQQELEEKRKATRRKEQAISDPRKKVAMKIENFRQNCPVDSPDFPGEIPMCPVQVEGPLGPETVTMVDVEQLRSRCLPLGRIEDLMDLRRREKKPKRDELLAFSPRSTGQKSQNSTLSLGSSMQPGNLTWEERRRQAHAKRQAAKVEAILRKLCSMRSGLPTDMHIDSAALQACLDYERMTGPINDLESLQALVAERLNGFIDSLANKLAADPDSGKTKLLVSLGKLSQAAIGEQLNMSQRMLGRLPSPKSTKTMDDNALKFARRFRCRRAWAIVRATIQWTRVFSAVKSRNRHIEIIKVSLGQLGEWARVKTAMKKAVLSVRHIQQNARRFLAQKRERCKQIEREWEMIEDANLELFYDKFNRKLVKQKMAQAGFSEKARKGNKRGLYKQMLNSIKGSGVSNWRDFRIPVAVRSQFVSAFYMSQLRTKVKTSADVLKTVRMVLAKHRELNGFMSFFGSSMGAQESFERPKTSAAWWSVSEEAVLYMVGLAAQSLKAKEVSPFAEHPAHKDLPRNLMYLSPQMDYTAALAEGEHVLDLAIMRLVQRSCWKHLYKEEEPKQVTSPSTLTSHSPPGPLGNIQQSLSMSRRLTRFQTNDSLASEEAEGPNLEDAFAAFTPRLRAIREEQLLEYRINNPRPSSAERESFVSTALL